MAGTQEFALASKLTIHALTILNAMPDSLVSPQTHGLIKQHASHNYQKELTALLTTNARMLLAALL